MKTYTKIPLLHVLAILVIVLSPSLLFGNSTQKISGTVVDAEGKTVSGATVTLVSPNDPLDVSHQTRTDENGRFELDTSYLELLGRKAYHAYSLIAVAKNPSGEETLGVWLHSVPILEKQDENNIKIELEPAVSFRGKVVDANDKPIAGAMVAICPFYRFGPTDILTDQNGNFQGKVKRSSLTDPKKLKTGINWRIAKDGYAVICEPVSPIPDSAKEVPPLTFRLSDSRKKAVFRAVDTDGQPMRNIDVNFNHFYLTTASGSLSYFTVQITRRTDADGRAEFDMIPSEVSESVMFSFSPSNGYSAKSWPDFQPATDDGKEITVEMLAPVPLSGTILQEDGKPLADTQIALASYSYFNETTKTDSNGKYSFSVFPEQVYGPPQIIGPKAEQFQIFGKNADDRVVSTDKPVEDFNFTAQKVVKVHGTIRYPDDYVEGASAGGQVISIDGRRLLVIYFYEGEVPDTSINTYRQMSKTDSQGNELLYWKSSAIAQSSVLEGKENLATYSAFLLPGTYTVAGNVERKTFDIKPGETEITLDVVASNKTTISSVLISQANKKTVPGRVVRLVDGKTVHVAGIIVEEEKDGENSGQTISDKDGTFTMDAIGHYDDTAVYARTKDFSEVGFAKVPKKGEPIEIELKPVASLKGRLVDSKTGKPVANSKIECIGPTIIHERMMTPPYFKDARSDKDGRISMTGFVPGLSYQMQCEPAKNPNEGTSAMLGFFLPLEPGEFDAGDISVVDIRSTNQMVDFIMEPFRREGSAKERFEKAKKQVMVSKKPVLIAFVEAKTDGDAQAFMMWTFQTAFGIQCQKFLSGFEYVPIDLSQEVQEKTQAAELLRELGVEKPKENDLLICVVDSDGKIVTKRNAGDFHAPRFKPDGELQVEFDQVLLLTFLREFGE